MSTYLVRTKQAIEIDRDRIRELVLKNKSAREIAKDLNIPLPTVISDIKVIVKRWKEEVPDFTLMRGQQLDRLNLMEKELWNAWEKSKEQAGKSTLTIRNGQNPTGRIETSIDETPGDVKYVEQIMKTVQERNKLLGMYAATKIQSEVTVKRDDSAIREEVLNIIEEARKRSLRNTEIIQTIETSAGDYVPVDSQKQLPETND